MFFFYKINPRMKLKTSQVKKKQKQDLFQLTKEVLG